jgi:glucose/arabinose dehydrogenase
MRLLLILLCFIGLSLPAFAADSPSPLVSGMKNPESVCLGKDGRIYVTEIGESGKDGDGQLSVIVDGKATPFATGLDDPKGVVFFQNAFYLTDKTRVVKVSEEGRATTFADADQFPTKPQFLNDIAVDPESGTLFVSDSGDLKGTGGAVFSINVKSGKTGLVVDAKSLPDFNTPNGLALDGGGPVGNGPMFGGAASHLLLADFGSGVLYRIKLADKSAQKIADGFDGADALTWDQYGRLFITSWKTGKVWGIPRPGQKAVLLSDKFKHAADTCLDATGRFLLVPDMEAGTLTALPTTITGWEVDDSPLAVEAQVAFPQLEFTGWGADSEDGRVRQLRPTLLTHAGDGSNRVFVLIQQGQIHFFPNDDKTAKTNVFLDIRDRVRYSDNQNEEGLLGLAFHPKFKTNGELFVFYTDVKSKMANVVSRFRVRKDDPNRADPASEEEIIRFNKPFWNHDGGTILFGPDGFLYVTHGDGGAANDPQENGQNLKSLLGKVLRLDVDHQANGKKYAIPKDNPFVGKSNAAPEIWAYGLRNVWRMAFDRKTGTLWAGDVGQNLFEEINLLKAGGNYGWNRRESLHPFGKKGVDVRDDLIDPIWEYHHDVGKSITGGLVYRGAKLPELNGAYLYADYVTMHLWALWYDPSKGRVVANREIKGPMYPVLSFGEDEAGEAYFLVLTADGRSIYRCTKTSK